MKVESQIVYKKQLKKLIITYEISIQLVRKILIIFV